MFNRFIKYKYKYDFFSVYGITKCGTTKTTEYKK